MDGVSREVVAVGIGAAIVLYSLWRRMQSRHKSVADCVDLSRQSVLLEGTKHTYCSPLSKNGAFEEPYDERAQCLYDVFKLGMEMSADGSCLGWRPSKDADYVWRTYSTVLQQAHQLAAGFRYKGVEPKSFVGIYARNSPEWLTTALACISQSMVVVPLYDTLGAQAASFIVGQAQTPLVVCDNAAKVKTLVSQAQDLTSLKTIVLVDESQCNDQLRNEVADAGFELLTFSELVRLGAEHPVDTVLPAADDLYIVCYTSGTTGNPKGVMLSHKNLICALSTLFTLEDAYRGKLTLINTNDAVISYLPLSHMFEQLVHWAALAKGAKIGYLFGDVRGLTSDMKALKPKFFPVVPRLLNRLYDQITNGLAKAGPVGRALFSVAYNRKLALLRQGIVTKDTVWDRLVFGKLQAELGGEVTFVSTGSAPISSQVLEMCRVALGAHIVEGYGQTETSAIGSLTMPGDDSAGHVGGPVPAAHIKLVDVPELNCYADDGKGEICLKGPCVCLGYYKAPDKTAETIDADGWLHTGDVGQWQANGTLKIIDRKKHIFKLAQGEYVAPEKIEGVYSKSPYVAQVFVDGSSLERWLIAVVVPDEKLLLEWFASQFGSRPSFAQACADDRTNKFLLKEMQTLGKAEKLNSIEQVKAIKVESELFSIENGLLTPTYKAKRPALRQHYQQDIDQLYKDNQQLK